MDGPLGGVVAPWAVHGTHGAQQFEFLIADTKDDHKETTSAPTPSKTCRQAGSEDSFSKPILKKQPAGLGNLPPDKEETALSSTMFT